MDKKISVTVVLKNLESALKGTIFKSRWLLAPFYVGLVFSLLLLIIKFIQELWFLTSHVFSMPESDMIIGILTLVEMSLVGCLLLMVIFSGYEIFVSKAGATDHQDRLDWMGKVDFSGLKLKLVGAIVAISAIDLLRTFLSVPEALTTAEAKTLFWKVAILMAFVFTGVLFAVMDKIRATPKSATDRL